jgi:hypothetical protein
MKSKSFCTAKEMVSKLKRLPQNGRKSLPATYPTRYCKPEDIGRSKKLNSQNIND